MILGILYDSVLGVFRSSLPICVLLTGVQGTEMKEQCINVDLPSWNTGEFGDLRFYYVKRNINVVELAVTCPILRVASS